MCILIKWAFEKYDAPKSPIHKHRLYYDYAYAYGWVLQTWHPIWYHDQFFFLSFFSCIHCVFYGFISIYCLISIQSERLNWYYFLFFFLLEMHSHACMYAFMYSSNKWTTFKIVLIAVRWLLVWKMNIPYTAAYSSMN